MLKFGPLFLPASFMGFVTYKNISEYKDDMHPNDKGELHDMVITSYGNEDGEDFFEMQNSWDTYWGQCGYGKIDPTLFDRITIPIGVF
ncbi:hypothetical protein RHGRI_000381 [Rhododendron griersonianum]|uniref:Peptidase C1A papain C-terminal domain-containing protein n=1 Tax=Rhododendron griersonianum TaxID=479676 RepID=A0AAV6LIQ4_9ERIC|nr:hypothetical protein RHGRI_000381 [Rhododendron griersonianum]